MAAGALAKVEKNSIIALGHFCDDANINENLKVSLLEIYKTSRSTSELNNRISELCEEKKVSDSLTENIINTFKEEKINQLTKQHGMPADCIKSFIDQSKEGLAIGLRGNDSDKIPIRRASVDHSAAYAPKSVKVKAKMGNCGLMNGVISADPDLGKAVKVNDEWVLLQRSESEKKELANSDKYGEISHVVSAEEVRAAVTQDADGNSDYQELDKSELKKLGIKADEDYIYLRVPDDAPDMPPEQKGKIFRVKLEDDKGVLEMYDQDNKDFADVKVYGLWQQDENHEPIKSEPPVPITGDVDLLFLGFNINDNPLYKYISEHCSNDDPDNPYKNIFKVYNSTNDDDLAEIVTARRNLAKLIIQFEKEQIELNSDLTDKEKNKLLTKLDKKYDDMKDDLDNANIARMGCVTPLESFVFDNNNRKISAALFGDENVNDIYQMLQHGAENHFPGENPNDISAGMIIADGEVYNFTNLEQLAEVLLEITPPHHIDVHPKWLELEPEAMSYFAPVLHQQIESGLTVHPAAREALNNYELDQAFKDIQAMKKEARELIDRLKAEEEQELREETLNKINALKQEMDNLIGDTKELTSGTNDAKMAVIEKIGSRVDAELEAVEAVATTRGREGRQSPAQRSSSFRLNPSVSSSGSASEEASAEETNENKQSPGM